MTCLKLSLSRENACWGSPNHSERSENCLLASTNDFYSPKFYYELFSFFFFFSFFLQWQRLYTQCTTYLYQTCTGKSKGQPSAKQKLKERRKWWTKADKKSQALTQKLECSFTQRCRWERITKRHVTKLSFCLTTQALENWFGIEEFSESTD